MSIYDYPKEEQERLEKAGVDYDLSACIEYNPQPFDLPDVERVLAVWPGQNDAEGWRWVLKVTDQCAEKNGGAFVFLQGGCDYTGWDCQSYARSTFKQTALQAAECAIEAEGVTGQDYINTGLGHMLFLLGGGDVAGSFRAVYDELVRQLETQKDKTCHELKDEELNTKDLPKI